MSNKAYTKQRTIQSIIGTLLIILSIVFIAIVSKGTTLQDRDASAVLITIPMGIYLIFTKRIVIK